MTHKVTTALSDTALETFASSLRGPVIRPGDGQYDQARAVFNAMIDRRPGVIVRCTGAADVIHAVNFARQNGLLVAVRGGGHHVSGNAVCDDGLVIDLSRMKGLQVDPAARTARVEPGITWGELNHDLQLFGLGASGGYISITGVPGLTLGGGFGWLVRKHGLALDNLLSVDVVTADGRLVKANAAEHDDLFWGMRGAGANFGVVTNFEFKVHPVGTVLAGPLIHPFGKARDVLRVFREHVAHAPEDLTWGALLFTVPDSPAFPQALRNAPVIVLAICYAGPIAKGEEVLRPVRQFGPPIADLVQPMPYDVAQLSADFVWPPGHRQYWKSSFLRDLGDDTIDTVVEHFARVPSRRTVIVIDHNGGGAISRVNADATAFGHRNWTYNFLVTSAWTDPAHDEENLVWTRSLWAAMRPSLANAVYVNYTGDQTSDILRSAYPAGTIERLTALKNKYDPSNVFRMNHNVEPTQKARLAGHS